MLTSLLNSLQNGDARRLAWAMGSPSLFDAANPTWRGRLRTDAWSAQELARCADWLLAIDHDPHALQASLGDPLVNTPLGHTFEKFVLFWQAARPDVRAATRGLIVRTAGRTVGEFDVVLLRHDGVIETLEVTVKYYLNLHPELGMAGCFGPRAFDRMTDKYSKMTTRQTDLGHTDAGRLAICGWLETKCGETRTPDDLMVENYALARGYVFHPSADATIPTELSPQHGRGLWQTDEHALSENLTSVWRNLSSREWLGPYQGGAAESGWPNDIAMPRMYAHLVQHGDQWTETERRFVVRAESGLLKAV
ncbi:MAG: DUF1853 family protein [Rhizobacter sp.]|nr:DUF1853 family protein [Burkholderiales bacterium]